MKNYKKSLFIDWKEIIGNILEGTFPISLVFYLIISNGTIKKDYIIISVIFFIIISLIVSLNWDEVKNKFNKQNINN